MKRRKVDALQRMIESEMQRQMDNQTRMERAQQGRRQAKTPEPQEPPPVFAECVIGYRVWTIDALGRLRPQSVNCRPWVPGENTAVCDAHNAGQFWISTYSLWAQPDPPPKSNHPAPAKGCHCGLYARFNPDDLQIPEYDLNAGTVTVCGAIAGWGTMQVHRDGMRAEKACVVALAVTENMPPEIRALVERVAATYRVPAVPFAALADEGLLHGTPLPAEAKPPKPETIDPGLYTGWLTQQMGSLQIYQPSYVWYGSSSNGRV